MLTEKQKTERSKGVGSSDAAAILGLDPFRSSYDVWLEKTGRAEPFAGNEATRLGSRLEAPLRAEVAELIGARVVAATSTFTRGVLRANVDGMVGEAKRGSPLVEIKTTGMLDGWGADGSDEVPERVRMQVMHQMLCSGSDRCYVACLRASRGLAVTVHPVEFDPFTAAAIEDACVEFWERHVLPDIAPDTVPSMATLARVRRDNPVVVDVPVELIEAERRLREALTAAERLHEEARGRLLAALGTATNGQGGDYIVSYRPVARRTVDLARLRAEAPDVATRYAVESTSRRLEVRKVRGGGVVE